MEKNCDLCDKKFDLCFISGLLVRKLLQCYY